MNIEFIKSSKEFLNSDIQQKLCIQNTFLLTEYYEEYYGSSFKDLSFFVMLDSEMVAYVSCCVLDGKLCKPGDGISIQLHSNDGKNKIKLYDSIIHHIAILAKDNECEEIIIKDPLVGAQLSTLGDRLLHNRYQSNLSFEMVINYENFSDKNYHASLRKSYKSLVNWGKKNLEIIYINHQNICLKSFQAFQQFHHLISKRKTRSDHSWNIQYNMIEQGYGELILGYLDGKLVIGSLFVDQDNTSIYFTGVYERELFNFGLSHYSIYQGVCRSHMRGKTSHFSLGCFNSDVKDPKLYNIQFFKKGFCDVFKPTIFWSKTLNEEKINE